MKSEPDEFSIADLSQKGTAFWDGVRNYQVRNLFRDTMSIGDKALFYHSNAGPKTGVVGVMEIVSNAYPDHTQFVSKSKYYDKKSSPEHPRWLGVEVRFVKKLPLVTLARLKSLEALIDSLLIKRGTRLSVLPLTKRQFHAIISLSEASV